MTRVGVIVVGPQRRLELAIDPGTLEVRRHGRRLRVRRWITGSWRIFQPVPRQRNRKRQACHRHQLTKPAKNSDECRGMKRSFKVFANDSSGDAAALASTFSATTQRHKFTTTAEVGRQRVQITYSSAYCGKHLSRSDNRQQARRRQPTCTRCRPTTRTGRLPTSRGSAVRVSVTTDVCNTARRRRLTQNH